MIFKELYNYRELLKSNVKKEIVDHVRIIDVNKYDFYCKFCEKNLCKNCQKK